MQKEEEFVSLLLQLFHLLCLQLGSTLHGWGAAPLLGHQVGGMRLRELAVVALHW